MHIVHVIPFASRIGGYETQGRLLARAMAARGLSVSIATDAAHARATRLLVPPEVPVHGIAYRFRRFSRRACEAIARRATVVHAHALAPLTACVIEECHRQRQIPAVVKVATAGDVKEFSDPYANPPQVLDAPAANPQWLANQQRDMSRAWSVLRASEQFIALNRDIVAELERAGIGGDRVLHLPNAVRIPPAPIVVKPDGHHAIYLGRFEERKRIGDLVDALRIVRQTVPDATLELIGRPSRNDLRRWRNEPGVTLPGPTEEPETALRRADLFVMASEREGCPNALLEAAALGLPCIATAIPGIREWFGGGHDAPGTTDDRDMVLVPPGDPGHLARAWATLLIAPDERARLGRAARASVERQAGLDAMVDRYLALYRDLTSTPDPQVRRVPDPTIITTSPAASPSPGPSRIV